jgi:hypothetical protein
MTWEFAARICIECLKHGDSEEAKADAEKELIRMAKILDKHIERDKDES